MSFEFVSRLIVAWLNWAQFCALVLNGWYVITLAFVFKFLILDRCSKAVFWGFALVGFAALVIVETWLFWVADHRPIPATEIQKRVELWIEAGGDR